MKDMKVEGLKELDKLLLGLDKETTRKSTGRRVLKNAGQPVADKMNSLAPDDPNTSEGLSASYSVSTRLNKSQKRKSKRAAKDEVEVYVGTDNPAGLQQEYGNVNHAPQPHARPAWNAEKRPTLDRIVSGLRVEIFKSLKRQENKKAKG